MSMYLGYHAFLYYFKYLVDLEQRFFDFDYFLVIHQFIYIPPDFYFFSKIVLDVPRLGLDIPRPFRCYALLV